jgi:hypothetical protein
MTVRLYRSTDASAPSLTGQVGSLVALLDAVLVNGYGSQTAAGWTKAYSATNKASYRMATSGNTGFYLDVDDAAPGGGGAREARWRGYEAMTAVATGTNAFPTSAQLSAAIICRKSNTADSTARAWYIVADGSCIYLFTDSGDNVGYSNQIFFGDFFSYKSSDLYNCASIGRTTENSNNAAFDRLPVIRAGSAVLTTQEVGHYVARSWTGVGGSIQFCKHSSMLSTYASYGPTGNMYALCNYPNGPDGGLELAPIWIGHSGNVRGYLKGLWAPCHYQPCGHGDLITGTGNMSGKSFIALNVLSDYSSSGSAGQIFVEYSDTWS